MAERLGISRYTLYLRIKAGQVPAFPALYEMGPQRFLIGAGGAPRALPHFHRREPHGVPWVAPEEVAWTLRVSTRLVQAACAARLLQVWRSPGGRNRARYQVAIDTLTRLPLPAETLVAARDP